MIKPDLYLDNEDIIEGMIIFGLTYDPGFGEGGTRAQIVISEAYKEDGSRYLLSAHIKSKGYLLSSQMSCFGEDMDIDNLIIPDQLAVRLFKLVFPLSKWKIKEPDVRMLDGPFFSLYYYNGCEIQLQSAAFCQEAVEKTLNIIAKECRFDRIREHRKFACQND